MTREITAPTVLSGKIRTSAAKGKNGTASSISVAAKPPVKASGKVCVRALRDDTGTLKAAKTALQVVVWLYRLTVCIVKSILGYINNTWERFEEKCGDEMIRMGTEGLFGEAKDGYYHTSEGFRLDASRVTVIESDRRGK